MAQQRRLCESSLAIDVAGLRFKNPVLLASGVLGITTSLLSRVIEAGAGGVVISINLVKEKEFLHLIIT